MTKDCKHNCVGGGPCCLRGDLKHSLHVCSVAECVCHAGERYGAKVEPVAHKPLAGVLFIDMRKLMGGGSCATQIPPRKGNGICCPS